jgi:hypothetical protein
LQDIQRIIEIFINFLDISRAMNKWLEILIGLVLVIAAVYFWMTNLFGAGTAALEFLKGGVVWMVIMVGLLFLMLGISDIKD